MLRAINSDDNPDRIVFLEYEEIRQFPASKSAMFLHTFIEKEEGSEGNVAYFLKARTTAVLDLDDRWS